MSSIVKWSKIKAENSIQVDLLRTDEYKAWRDKNLSGRYHLLEFYNERPVYKRDKNTSDGEAYLYHHKDTRKWYSASGRRFRGQIAGGWMYLDSTERDIRKLSGTWKEYDGSAFNLNAKVTIT